MLSIIRQKNSPFSSLFESLLFFCNLDVFTKIYKNQLYFSENNRLKISLNRLILLKIFLAN